jgi:hypothetical protein
MTYMARKFGWEPADGSFSVEPLGNAFDQIRALGAKNCLLSTDLGTLELPLPAEGLREFIYCLLDLGMTADEIQLMVRDNPEKLLGLTPWADPLPLAE